MFQTLLKDFYHFFILRLKLFSLFLHQTIKTKFETHMLLHELSQSFRGLVLSFFFKISNYLFIIVDLVFTVDLFKISQYILIDFSVSETYFEAEVIFFCNFSLESIMAFLLNLYTNFMNYVELFSYWNGLFRLLFQ